MRKQILFTAIVLLSLAGLQAPALADHDDWYKKYDRDNDGRWDHNEFQNAQREWELAHHKHPMTEKQLREYYDRLDKDKDGYWNAKEARRAHHW